MNLRLKRNQFALVNVHKTSVYVFLFINLVDQFDQVVNQADYVVKVITLLLAYRRIFIG